MAFPLDYCGITISISIICKLASRMAFPLGFCCITISINYHNHVEVLCHWPELTDVTTWTSLLRKWIKLRIQSIHVGLSYWLINHFTLFPPTALLNSMLLIYPKALISSYIHSGIEPLVILFKRTPTTSKQQFVINVTLNTSSISILYNLIRLIRIQNQKLWREYKDQYYVCHYKHTFAISHKSSETITLSWLTLLYHVHHDTHVSHINHYEFWWKFTNEVPPAWPLLLFFDGIPSAVKEFYICCYVTYMSLTLWYIYI